MLCWGASFAVFGDKDTVTDTVTDTADTRSKMIDWTRIVSIESNLHIRF